MNNNCLNVVFESVFGSHLYGLSTPNSDKEYKGIFLPDLKSLVFGRAPKTMKTSTSDGIRRCNSDDVEKEFFNINYFVELACGGQTVAFDLLFGDPKRKFVTKTCDFVEFLVENRKKFITKKLGAIMGYAAGQAIKYSAKGNIYNDLLSLREEVSKVADETDKLFIAKSVLKEFVSKNPELFALKEFRKKPGETYFTVGNSEFSLNTKVYVLYESLDAKTKRYGARTKVTAESGGADWKALSHSLRCIFVAQDLMTKGDFSYPLDQTDLLMKVKLGEMDLDSVLNLLDFEFSKANSLISKSQYPDKVDVSFAEDKLFELWKKNLSSLFTS